MIVVGWPPLRPGTMFGMNSIGYAARVFSVRASESRSSARVDRIDDDVFEHGAEAVHGRPDLRFGGLREVDGLRVAAALEVEHAVVRPAVLVVADQRAVRIGRERGLAGAGEAEEDRDVAFGSDVRRAVHRQHVAQRHQVVHQREDRLLDLARILRAADQDHLPREVDQDERRSCAFRRARGSASKSAASRTVNSGLKSGSGLRADEQVLREQALPSEVVKTRIGKR